MPELKPKKKSRLWKQPLGGRMSLNKKMFVFHVFLRLAGSKGQGEEGARFTFCSFQIYSKSEAVGISFFFKLLCQVWVEKTSWKPCLGGCGMEAGIHLFYLPIFTSEALKQNSKAMATLPAACRQEEHSPRRILFPWHQQDQHQRYVIESAVQMPSNVCFIPVYESEQRSVKASYPASPDKSAVTSEETKHGEIPLSRLLRAPITHRHQQCLFYCNSCNSMCRFFIFFFLNPTSWSQKMGCFFYSCRKSDPACLYVHKHIN